MLSSEDQDLLDRVREILPALETARSRGQLSSHITPDLNDVKGGQNLPRKNFAEAITGSWSTTQQFTVHNDIIVDGWVIWSARRNPATQTATFVHFNTGNRTYTFKDANGTVAFTSDIAAFPPRLTTTARLALTPVEGDIVYDLTLHKLFLFTTVWEQVTSV